MSANVLVQLLLIGGPDFVDLIMKMLGADKNHEVTPEEWANLKSKIQKPFDSLWPSQN